MFLLALLLGTASGRAESSRGVQELSSESGLATQIRRPVRLLVAGDRIVVGNRRSGTVSLLERETAKVFSEHRVATRIADMALLDASRREILVLDDAAGELRRVRLRDHLPMLHTVTRVPTSAVKLAVARERRQVFVTAKWSHRLISLTLDDQSETVSSKEAVDLPFAPQELLLVHNDETLLVADAFGGRITVLSVADMRTLAVRELHGHNIRGLAMSADGKRLHVAHQQMARHGLADYEELHWGRFVANGIQDLDLDEMLRADSDDRIDGWLNRQGGIGGATGDPAGVVTGTVGTGSAGITAMAFAGVGEVVIQRAGRERRIEVGERPEAMAIDGDRLYVANRFADSISIIDLARQAPVQTVSLGPSPPLTAADRGEKLFFDARLSHDGWMSCHSCHTDGHTSGLLVDTLGDGDYGAPKGVPSLLGTRETGPWGWTGSADSLAEQVRKSVLTTMHGDDLTDVQTDDLVAYLRSLDAPPPRDREDQELVHQGGELFESLACVDCHSLPRFTSKATFDVGLVDERKRAAFNPPSLRGVGQRERLFHDGRAKGIEDVVLTFRHQQGRPLKKEEAAALVAYLRSL